MLVKFFILTIILLFSVLNNSTLIAATVLGTGSNALLGNDLTDPEDDGDDSETDGLNFNWTSINTSSPQKTFAGEGAYNVFDNNVGSVNAKWCCEKPTQWIYVQLSQSYVLSHFTITSGNDVPGRDPDIWKIQGSNDGSNWTDIYSYSNDGNSPFSARHQVIKYTGAGDDFATPDSYSYFRYYVTSSVDGTRHQINELEFFGIAKDVTGSIDAQNMMAKTTLTEFTSIVNDRLRYLRQNRINKDFTKNNIKLDFGNAMLTSLAKFIPASKIHLTNEILTSLAIDIPTSKTYLTNTMLTSLAKVTPVSKVYLTDYIPKNWSSWSEGSVSMTKVGDSKNSSSKEIDVQSLALGFDKKLNNNNLLGFAMQFSQSDSEVGTSGTGIDSKNYNLSVYGTRPLNDDNFVEGLFGVVLTENELVRKSGANTLTGSRNGTQIFGSINYGKTIDKEDFNLTPIARVDLGYTELDGYTETGTDALTYGKQTVESGLVSIGLEIHDNIKFSNSSLQPFGSFQYGLDFSNSSEAKMNYVSDTSTIYTYTPGINSTHLLTAEVGFNYELQDHLKLIGIFKRIQGSGSQQTNHIRFGFHYISQRETEYAISLDGSDELMTGLNISKNINGFDIKVGSNYSLMSEIPDYGINLKISNKF